MIFKDLKQKKYWFNNYRFDLFWKGGIQDNPEGVEMKPSKNGRFKKD